MTILLTSLILSTLTQFSSTTIDLNAPELQYIADHLTVEECRRLVAAAHYKTWEQPNSLDQAERKISKDLTCIQLLHHWNSAPNEGKGETHEILEHRLRQMGKYDLADWLGRTVFHELSLDLNRSLEHGFKDLVSSSNPTTEAPMGPTFIPVIKNEDPTEYSSIDTLLYALVIGLMLTAVGFIIRFGYIVVCVWRIKRKKLKQDTSGYEALDDETSASETEEEEDKFDLRNYTRTSK